MTSPRNLLLIALLFLGYLMWNAGRRTTARVTPPAAGNVGDAERRAAAAAPATGEVPNASSATPSTASPTAPVPTGAGTPNAAATPHVVATSDVLRIEIDPHGGNIVIADLLAYPQQPKDFAHPVRLLDDSASRFFEAQSGLVSASGAAPDHTATFWPKRTTTRSPTAPTASKCR